MDYTYIRGEDLLNYVKKDIWNLFNSYIDSHSQRLIYEYPGDEVQAITIFQSKCLRIKCSDQIRYGILFHQVIHIGGESAINSIKIFYNDKDLAISVGNSYSEVQLIRIFLDN